jgi:hypothetical protein
MDFRKAGLVIAPALAALLAVGLRPSIAPETQSPSVQQVEAAIAHAEADANLPATRSARHGR